MHLLFAILRDLNNLFMISTKKRVPNVIRLTLAVCFLSVVCRANFSEDKIELFKFCWQTELENVSTQQILFQTNNIFVSMADGSLVNLNILNGSTEWRADLGGSIVAQSGGPEANTIYVASQTTTLDENKTPIVVIRALSSNTGITIWQKEFPAVSKALLISNNNLLILALDSEIDKQKLLALNASDGKTIWSQKLSTSISSQFAINRDSLYFATKDRLLWNFKLSDGTIVKRFEIPHEASHQLVVQNDSLVFSDSTGYVSAIRTIDEKTLWTLRFGAAVQNILPINDKVLFTSLDDFVYFHKISNGKRLWRKRFANRPLGTSLISNSVVGLIISNESSGTILNLKTGKPIDLLNFGNNNTALGPPFYFNNYLVVSTSNGIRAFSQNPANCQKT